MSNPAVNSVICPPLGDSIPSTVPHAISVSLPTWRDNVGYEEGDKRVLDAMCTGYPRFFIHKSIQKLASICESKFGLQNEQCILVPSATIANHCRNFMIARFSDTILPLPVRLVQYLIHSEEAAAISSSEERKTIALHIVFFPADAFPIARQFWQHTGLGISSRMADRCLAFLAEDAGPGSPGTSPKRTLFSSLRNKHYSFKGPYSKGIASDAQSRSLGLDVLCGDQTTYLEERYGRNMPLSAGITAKRTLRRRIAGVLVHDDDSHNIELRPSNRGVEDVTEEDVYLFPTGMTAIWSAHQLCLNALPPAESVCFGFPYTDTLKILQKWGPGCHFFGNGTDADIDALAALLSGPNAPRILALFCEFPSNPLLRSANLIRLRELADQHGFVLVVDETIGSFANVQILPYTDILVSSLTKVFSGEVNVMGGSLILNPKSQHYSVLKAKLNQSYEDAYWDEDAIYMERNSRDFAKRVRVINSNTEAICDYLHSQINVPNPIIKDVFYPKWKTRQNYDICKLPSSDEDGKYGGLFSVTFSSPAASEAFFNALPCAKGPSLGTNFTLACPYTILAHFTELDWAAKYGVEEGLVRVSVGMEAREVLLKWFVDSVKKAEEVVRATSL